MKGFAAVVERCADTGFYVGYVPGFAGAHSQGESLDELQRNLCEVIETLLEDGAADAAWETEIARRIARFDAGDTETVPATEVFARLRAIAPDR